MVTAGNLAVVPDKLHPAEHLPDGEESQALGKDDAANGHLGLAHGLDLREEGGWVDCRDQGLGVLYRLDEALEVSLEGGHGSAMRQRLGSVPAGRETHGGVICCPLKTILAVSKPTRE